MRDAQELARIFKVFSVDTRVRIVQLLEDGALCVGALSARLSVTQAAVSQHLRVLRDAGVVAAEKRGYYVHYRINARVLATWQDAAVRFLGTRGSAEESKPRRQGGKPCAEERTAARSRRT